MHKHFYFNFVNSTNPSNLKCDKMKRILSVLTILVFTAMVHAQEPSDTLWRFNGVTSLNFSQLALVNWAAGGEGSLAGNARVDLSAAYMSSDEKVSWNNDLILGYGLIRQGDAENPFVKSDDKIDLASKFGYKASKMWYYTGLLNFRTQFDKGYANPRDIDDRIPISEFMAPGYLNLSFGMDYKPSKTFTILLAPLTGKMTFVRNDSLANLGAFGVKPGQNTRSEFGGYVKIAFTKELMKNVRLNTKIDLFSNYLENPQYVDVNFDLLLTLKVNEYISASLITQLIYDYDIKFDILDATGEPTGEVEPRIQLKELFGVGLTYNF